VQKAGIQVQPEVMIPLAGFEKELDPSVAVAHASSVAIKSRNRSSRADGSA
jgi:hypothetical protein